MIMYKKQKLNLKKKKKNLFTLKKAVFDEIYQKTDFLQEEQRRTLLQSMENVNF